MCVELGWKGSEMVSCVQSTRDLGLGSGVWGPPWSSSRCGTRLWYRAPCHRSLCWGAVGGLECTLAPSLHHHCFQHSELAGSSGHARTVQSTGGWGGSEELGFLANLQLYSFEPGSAFDPWLSSYMALRDKEQAEHRALGLHSWFNLLSDLQDSI